MAAEVATLGYGEGDHISLLHSHGHQHRTRRGVTSEDMATNVRGLEHLVDLETRFLGL